MGILAGKIDGPISTIALFTYDFNEDSDQYEVEQKPLYQMDFTTKEYEHDIPKMIDDFFSRYPDEKENVESACFGIAGKVESTENEHHKQSKIKRDPIQLETNYFTESDFSKKLLSNLPVSFINDMDAIGYSIFLGNKEPLEPLNQGKKSDTNEHRALMLVSDGLGKALWLWDEQEKEFVPISSEGGHRDFSLSSKQDMELWQYWSDRNDNKPISWEFFLSNSGLVKIYEFLQQNYEQESEQVKIAIESNRTDPSPIINQAFSASQPDPLCRKAVEMFISIWGAEAGNIALDYKLNGGLYLGGNSILVDCFKDESLKNIFMEKFTTKGEYAAIPNQDIPVKIYREEDIVLRGAARFAARFIAENLFLL